MSAVIRWFAVILDQKAVGLGERTATNSACSHADRREDFHFDQKPFSEWQLATGNLAVANRFLFRFYFALDSNCKSESEKMKRKLEVL